jgi:outer membrane autotransporter protein
VLDRRHVARPGQGRSGARARAALLGTSALVAISIGTLGSHHSVHAQTFTWQGGNADYNTAGNWTPGGGPPNAAGHTAVFGPVGNTTINLATDISPDIWRFNADSQSFILGGVGEPTFGLADASGGGIRNFANNGQTITINNNVFGGGGIRQEGNSTLVLNGDSLFTGGTSLVSGTISVGSDTALGTGTLRAMGGTLNIQNSFAVSNDTSLLANLTINVGAGPFSVHDGNISETGGSFGITKTGAGMLVLAGVNNTYTGPTNIVSGVLIAVTDGALPLNTAVTVNAGATLAIDDLVLASVGSLSGAGDVLIGNGGAAFLTVGNNGLSTVFSGTINGGGGVFGFDGNGALTLTGTGNISDLSVCACGGTGTLNISGSFTVNATTQVGGGVLMVSNGGVLNSLGGAAISGAPAAVTVTGAGSTWNVDAGLAVGFFGGTGILTIADGGVVNSTGVTTIDTTGVLNLGNGGLAGTINTAAIVNDGQIVANFTDTSTLAAVIDGTGSLTKLGPGVLTLTAANTYTGATTVNGGGLVVNGSIADSSSVTVNGGFVGGTGTLPSTTIAGGALAPGNSIGTITVQGNLTFTSAGTYAVELGPTSVERDLTIVTGTAALAGKVAPSAFGGLLVPGTTYTILTAGSRTGTFGSVDESTLPGGFNASLSYAGNTVQITLSAGLRDVPGLNGDQRGIATIIDNVANSGGGAAFLPLLNLPAAAVPAALSQLSGPVGTGIQQAGMQSQNMFLDTVLNPFRQSTGALGAGGGPALGFAQDRGQARSPLPRDAAQAYAAVLRGPPGEDAFERRWGVWGMAFGGIGRTDGDAGFAGTRANAYGFAIGADRRLSPDTVLGFALAGGETSWTMTDGLGSGRSDTFQAGLYGAHRFGAAYVSGAAAYAWHGSSTSRTITLAGTGQLNSDFNANSFGGRIEGGYRVPTAWAGVTPYGALQVLSIRTPGYSETATPGVAAFALTYNARTTTATRSEIGLWFDRTSTLNPDARLTLRSRLAWAHDFNTDNRTTAAFQTLPLSTFTVQAATAAPDFALLTGMAVVQMRSGWSFSLKGDGEFAPNTQIYSGTGTARYAW